MFVIQGEAHSCDGLKFREYGGNSFKLHKLKDYTCLTKMSQPRMYHSRSFIKYIGPDQPLAILLAKKIELIRYLAYEKARILKVHYIKIKRLSDLFVNPFIFKISW